MKPSRPLPAILSDDDIRSIFQAIVDWPGPEKESFLRAYGNAVLKAGKDDFRVLRATSLLFIGKYNLVGYLQKSEKKK